MIDRFECESALANSALFYFFDSRWEGDCLGIEVIEGQEMAEVFKDVSPSHRKTRKYGGAPFKWTQHRPFAVGCGMSRITGNYGQSSASHSSTLYRSA